MKGSNSKESRQPSATSSTIGKTGDTAFNNTYFFIKTNAGWKRIALSSF